MDAQWLAAEFVRTGRSQSDLARYLKVLPSTVNKMVKGKRRILSEEAETIRAFFGHSRNPDRRVANDTMRVTNAPFTMSDIHSWPNDVPVMGNAIGGATSGGDVVLNGDTGMRVRRPPRFEGRVDIFALFVQGDSMAPRYSPGELIYLEKARPPQIGDFVVVEMKPGADGEQPAYLKQLVGRSGGRLKLKQFNPEKTLELDMAKVLQVIRVMNTTDLLG